MATTVAVGSDHAVLLPYAPASVAGARHELATDLQSRGLAQTLVDDAALVLSEMLSNALKHARPLPDCGQVRLGWRVHPAEPASGSKPAVPAGVTIQVSDGGGSTMPRVVSAAASATGGRGLGIVQTLASDWGVAEKGSTITVWATLRERPRSSADGSVVVLPR